MPYALVNAVRQQITPYSGPGLFISLYQVEATIKKKDLPVDRKAQGLEKGQETATFGETEVIAIMVATS